MPRFCAIDVGSNAIRLRIIEAESSSRSPAPQLALIPGERASAWREILSLRAPVRLGGEVFVSGKLTPASIGLACAALRDFKREIDIARVAAYRATATSAVREAQNGTTLVERARREAGIELEVIEGVEEARLIQLAVTRRLPIEPKRALLVDVGGGSTELTVLENGKSTFSISLPVGTVRLLETFLKGAATVDAEKTRLVREAIDRAYSEAKNQLGRGTFAVVIGTGGSIDALAELCPAKRDVSSPPKTGRIADVEAMRALYNKMAAMTSDVRAKTFGLRPDRADTILPAAIIFTRVAELAKADVIVAPGVGLKEGILEELIDKHFRVWDSEGEAESVLLACMRLGRRYQFDEAHGERVTRFATQIFDDLIDRHRLDSRDRLLLRAAALLHDIGDFVRYDGHHKHSYYLIEHADIMGLSPEERSIVANVARYHRKSPPDPAHPNFRDLGKEARGKVRALAAILRIADALDREHLGKIESVRAIAEKSRVVLSLVGNHERELEEWTVRAKSALFKDVFGLDVAMTDASRESHRPHE